MSEWLWPLLLFAVACSLVALALMVVGYRRLLTLDLLDLGKKLEAAEKTARDALQAAQASEQRAQVSDRLREQAEARLAEHQREAQREITTLRAQVELLTNYLRAEGMAPPPLPPALPVAKPEAGRLLAVLPDYPALTQLNLEVDAKALRAANWPGELDILAGRRATREGLADNLMANGRARALYFGGHAGGGGEGEAEGVYLTDGLLAPTALALFVQKLGVELVVLNACSSDALAFRLINAGAKAVVSTTRPVTDPAAIQLASRFVLALAGGRTVREALNYLALLFDEEVSALFRVDGEDDWRW